jgi:hypothetical protein
MPPKKKAQSSPGSYPEGLKQALIDLPHIKTAYINGEHWHFHPRPGFDPVDRADVLESEKTDNQK